MTKLDKLMYNRHKNFHGKNVNYASHLRTFCEMSFVAKRNKIQGKFKNKGALSVFVDYADNHFGDMFKFYNTENGTIFQSRDVR